MDGFKAASEDLIKRIELIGVDVKELKTLIGGTDAKTEAAAESEMHANVQIAFRHLEDASSRLAQASRLSEG